MKNRFIQAAITALVLASPLASADAQYPAADFQPQIIFQDKDLIAKHAKDAVERAAALNALAAKASQAAAVAEPAAAAEPAGGAAASGAWVDNLPVMLMALALFGFAFWPRKQAGAPASAPMFAGTSLQPVSGETGVARYLRMQNGGAPAAARQTKVELYLNSLPPSTKVAETGVAKYLKALGKTG